MKPDQIQQAFENLTEVMIKERGYAYSAGFMQSMLLEMLRQSPRKLQQQLYDIYIDKEQA